MHFWRTWTPGQAGPGAAGSQARNASRMYFCLSRPAGPSSEPVSEWASQFSPGVENSSETWYVEPSVVPGWRQVHCSESCRCRIQHGFSRSGCDSGKFQLCASESPETAFVIADETLSHYPHKYSHMFQNPHSMQQNESVGGIRRKIISHSLLLPGTIESVSLFKIFATRQKRPANKVV